MTLEAFARAVVEYRRAFNGSVTSWGRSATRNHFVGGAPASKHLIDLAADVVPEAGTKIDHRTAHANALGLWLWAELDHDHLEPLDIHKLTPPRTL